MSDLSTIRAAAAAHDEQIQATGWYKAVDLMERWNVGRDTVLAIPRDKLPFLEFGGSHMRRYKPADVEAYEASRIAT